MGELYVALTSDRGLAGAVHSNVCKNIRQTLHDKVAAGESLDNVKILCVGDKSRAFMQRFFPKQLIMVGSEIGRLPPTFNDAAKIANAIMTCGHDFDSGKLLYNYYKSVVSYDTTAIPIYSQEVISNAEKLTVYDSLDADVIQSYMEKSLASLVYYALKEGATSEQSSRMTAMEETEVKDEDALNGDAEQVEEEAPPEGDDVKEPEDAGAEVDEVAAEGENDDD